MSLGYIQDMETPKPLAAALNYWLRKRTRRGLNQAKLAQLVGITQPSISLIRRGKIDGTEKTRRAIAAACGFNYEDFLSLGRWIQEGRFSPPILMACLSVKSG